MKYLPLVACLMPLAAEQLTERQVLARFTEQSPAVREVRASSAVTRAEQQARTLYANPSVSYRREGAGYNEFFEAEQAVSLNGRRRLLRDAGTAAVAATEAGGEAFLWMLRSQVRTSFYRVLAAQVRASTLDQGLGQLRDVIGILQKREQEGEGSKYDRLRAERELIEALTELRAAEASLAREKALLAGFLPPQTTIESVVGTLAIGDAPLTEQELRAQALAGRLDYRAQFRQLDQLKFEVAAAERLKYPDPILSAGYKRAEILPGLVGNGAVIGVTVPLPSFNRGQAELSRLAAERERLSQRLAFFMRQIEAEVDAAARALKIRKQALDDYRRETSGSDEEITRIARTAYEEGELDILGLLDAYRLNRQLQIRLVELAAAAKEAQIELDRVTGVEVAP